MKLRPGFLFLIVAALGSLIAALAGVRLSRAEEQAANSVALLRSVTQDCAEILALRAREEVVALAERPKEDVYAQISRTLLATGIPSGTLRDLAPEGDRPVDGAPGGRVGPQLRTQSMRFTLEPVTSAQLGVFLSRWSAEQQVWRIAGIELVHQQGKADDSYSCRLNITATYIADQ